MNIKMNTGTIVLFLLIFAGFNYFIKQRKIYAVYRVNRKKQSNKMTLPKYFGYVASMWSLIPALLVLLAIEIIDEPLLKSNITNYVQAENIEIGQDLDLYLNDIKNIKTDNIKDVDPIKLKVHEHYQNFETLISKAKTIIVISLAVLMTIFGFKKVTINTPARV